VLVGGKQGNRVAGISDYVGNRREMEERNSVAVGSPIGQNETANTHWFPHDHPGPPSGGGLEYFHRSPRES
jgi:hypothetical protein